MNGFCLIIVFCHQYILKVFKVFCQLLHFFLLYYLHCCFGCLSTVWCVTVSRILSDFGTESWSIWCTACDWWVRIWCQVLGLCWDGFFPEVFQNNNSMWEVRCLISYVAQCDYFCCCFAVTVPKFIREKCCKIFYSPIQIFPLILYYYFYCYYCYAVDLLWLRFFMSAYQCL